MAFRHIISTEASPNTTSADIKRIVSELINPFHWMGNSRRHYNELLRFFQDSFQAPYVYGFLQGRQALYAGLSAAGVRKDDEVCIQAFTCVVVPNAVTALGAHPVYVDIDATYNMDVQKLEATLRTHPRVRAVVIQHTFGVAAHVEAIKKVCSAFHVRLVEDCAHALWSTYADSLLGTFGDVAIFSFGRDKVISSTHGGIVLSKSPEIGLRIEQLWTSAQALSRWRVAQHLFHPIVFEIGKLLFSLHPRLLSLWVELWKKTTLIPVVLTAEEKKGRAPALSILPEQLARRALHQLSSIERMTMHRKEIVAIYTAALSAYETQFVPTYSSSSLLRYTIHHPQMSEIRSRLKKEGIYLGDWYDTVIAPHDVSVDAAQYTLGSCPQAERCTQNIANLPTHIGISSEQAHHIVQRLQATIESL